MHMDSIKHINCSALRWLLILVFLIVTLVSGLWQTPLIMSISPILTVVSLFAAVWLHGLTRYGLKNMLVFFIITCLISLFFEALSIRTGVPFGFYYYDKLSGPRVFDVPLIIMFAYFATGYSAWTLAQILLEQFNRSLNGLYLLLVPIIAAFIMVLWDLCIDPLCATVASLWVWRDGGAYFGVPLMNYFGWLMVVYLIYQSYALYLNRFPSVVSPDNSRLFRLEIVALYFIQGLTQIVQFIGARSHHEIYAAMALISVFTMIFIALLCYIKVYKNCLDHQ